MQVRFSCVFFFEDRVTLVRGGEVLTNFLFFFSRER